LPLLPLALVACGSSDDDDDAPAPAATNAVDEADGDADESNDEAPAPTMTGKWNGTFDSGVVFTMDLNQSGDVITGTYKTGAMNGTVSGSIVGNALTMTVSVVGGATAQLTGAPNDARTSMNGNFNIVAGGGGNGTWSATK
jgi:hypothetical protein